MDAQIYIIDIIFLLLSVTVLWSAWQTKVNVAVIAYISFFIIFTQAIELIPTPESAFRENTNIRAVTDMLCLGNVFFILLFAWLTPRSSIGDRLITALATVPTRACVGAVLSWYAIKSYLLLKYGAAAFAAVQGGLSAGSEQVFSYSDFALSTLAATLFLGGILIFVCKAASGDLSLYRWSLWLFVSFSFAIYLFVGEAIVGARRTIGVVAIFALVSFMARRNLSLVQLLKRHGRMVGVILCGVIALSAYYETVRFNIFDPQLTLEMESDSYVQKFDAAMLLLTPNRQSNLDKNRFFRPGPFTVIYDVVDRALFQHVSANGDFTKYSLEHVLPRFIDPDKPLADIDGYMAERLGIAPHRLSPEIDLANSNLALMLGDFGLLGLLAAVAASFIPIYFFSFVLIRFSHYSSVAILAAGGLFASVGDVEGTISFAIVFIRDFFVWGFVFALIEWLIREFRVHRDSPQAMSSPS